MSEISISPAFATPFATRLHPNCESMNQELKALLSMAIKACRKHGKYVGICGQGPSDHPDLAEWLMGEGIESVSLNPDTVVETWTSLAELAKKKA